MLKIMDWCDFYGKSLDIQISGRKKVSTPFGSILGIMSFLTILILSTFFVKDLFERKSVKIMYNQIRNMKPVTNLSNIPMVFKITDRYGKPIENYRLYDIDVVKHTYTLHKKFNETSELIFSENKIKYEKCDLNASLGEYKDYFLEFPYLKDFFCIRPNSNNLTLDGVFSDAKGFSFLNFYINKCDNKTNNNCLSIKEIDETLVNVNFIFSFLDYQIDHNNSTKSYNQVLKTSTLTMNSQLMKKYIYYFKQVFYETDYGWMFQDKKVDTFYQQEDMLFDIRAPGLTKSSDLSFGIFSITNEGKVDYYFRSYSKLQTIVADIGGMVKGILLVSTIINYIFTRNYSLLQIINSLFDFEEEKENKENYVLQHKNTPYFNSRIIMPNIHVSGIQLINNVNSISNNNKKTNQKFNLIIQKEKEKEQILNNTPNNNFNNSNFQCDKENDNGPNLKLKKFADLIK